MSHKRSKLSAPRRAATAATFADADLLPRKAFSVTGAPDYSEAAPQTAEEYLRRVKWEARNQPRVFTAPIDPRRFDHLQTKGYVRRVQPLPPTSARVMPSAEWESAFAAQFADIRLSFAHYSQLHPPAAPQPRPPSAAAAVAASTTTTSHICEAWARYCLGLGSSSSSSPSPSLPTVASFDQLTTRGVLAQLVTQLQQAATRAQAQYKRGSSTTPHEREQSMTETDMSAAAVESSGVTAESDEDVEAEEEADEGVEDEEGEPYEPAVPSQSAGSASRLSSSALDSLSVLSASTARWLYCLLAHLQKPLPSETEVQLRQLYRVCGTLRAEAGQQLDLFDSQQPTDRKQDEDEQRANGVRAAEETAMWCNLLLTIVDRIFGQRIPLQTTAVS